MSDAFIDGIVSRLHRDGVFEKIADRVVSQRLLVKSVLTAARTPSASMARAGVLCFLEADRRVEMDEEIFKRAFRAMIDEATRDAP